MTVGEHGRGRAQTLQFLTTITTLLGLVAAGAASAADSKITATDGAGGDGFGDAVAISGQTVVIGARADGDKGFASGSAYFYALDAGVWSLQSKVTAADGAFGDQFGSSVAVSGDTVVVGAWHESDNGAAAGAAYVFADGIGLERAGQAPRLQRRRGG